MLVSLFRDESDFISFRREPEVRIILTENETVFAPACHHTVRLVCSFGYKVINERSDIRFVTGQNERVFSFDFQRRINACHESLCRRFFIAARSVRLACRIKSFQVNQFQCGIELQRIDEIIFDGVGGPHEFHIFKAGYGF